MSFEQKQHVASEDQGHFNTAYSHEEFNFLQSSLSRKLGPEYVSRRSGPGGFSVSYIESWKAIELANEIFGFNGWSSSIRSINVEFMDENKENGRISLGLSVIVRVTIKDGAYHEDIGYGSIDNCRGKASAFEKCKKEGTTDALKRALRNFGNSLGNCMYDKYYLREVGKMKPPTYHFDSGDLFRKTDPAARESFIKKQKTLNSTRTVNNQPLVNKGEQLAPRRAAELNDEQTREIEMYADEELDNIFVEDDIIAHLAVAEDTAHPAANNHHSEKAGTQINNKDKGSHNSAKPVQRSHTYPVAVPQNTSDSVGNAVTDTSPKTLFDPLKPNTGTPSPKFISARAAAAAEGVVSAPFTNNFNPRLDSPSIRKTSIIDHSKSLPVQRASVLPIIKQSSQTSPVSNNSMIRDSESIINERKENIGLIGVKRSLHDSTTSHNKSDLMRTNSDPQSAMRSRENYDATVDKKAKKG
nr:rad22 [Schizosaccharomyces pombe]